MLYFKINAALEVVAISANYPPECRGHDGNGRGPWALIPKPNGDNFGAGWLARWDILEHAAPWMFAQHLADSASRMSGERYVAVDKGESVSPRYDVILAPKVGDEASMAFNGDYYPVGNVVAVRPDLKRVVVDGSPRGRMIFIRRGLSGSWVNKGWSLVSGAVSRLNPEF